MFLVQSPLICLVSLKTLGYYQASWALQALCLLYGQCSLVDWPANEHRETAL